MKMSKIIPEAIIFIFLISFSPAKSAFYKAFREKLYFIPVFMAELSNIGALDLSPLARAIPEMTTFPY
jgi:hypothetical protein